MITKKDIKPIKKAILHYLCDDWNNHKRGKAHDENQSIFNRQEGWQVFDETDLDMVMEKVVKGLSSCLDKEVVSKEHKALLDIKEYIEKFSIDDKFTFPLMTRDEEEQIKSSIEYEFKDSLYKDILDIINKVIGND